MKTNGATLRRLRVGSCLALLTAPQLEVSSRSNVPAIIDISDLVQPGHNTIAVQNGNTLSTASMQAVAKYGSAQESVKAPNWRGFGDSREFRGSAAHLPSHRGVGLANLC